MTMVYMESVPFERVLGKEIGAMMAGEHERNGVKLLPKAGLKGFRGCNGKVCKVVLQDDTQLDADLVIVGFGARPATEFLKDSGLEMRKDGGIITDPFMQTSNKDVFAAGDIAVYPYWPTGSRTRTEHWIVALDQGTFAAFNMLGKLIPYGSLPFFWTRHYNKSLQYVGDGSVGYEDIHITGDLAAQKFVAYYINKNDQVVAVAGMNNTTAVLSLFEAMQQNVMPKGSEFKNGNETPEKVQGRVKQNTNAGRCKRANCCQKKSIA